MGHCRSGIRVLLQHVLNEIDAPPGTISFVSQELVGRTGRQAKAAVYAASEDRVSHLDGRVSNKNRVDLRLHDISGRLVQISAYIRPGLNTRVGSKVDFKPR